MKKALLFGILAAGAAVVTAMVYKNSKNRQYLAESDFDDDGCDDCCCDCDADICYEDGLDDIPAEKADDSCISGESGESSGDEEVSAKADETQQNA